MHKGYKLFLHFLLFSQYIFSQTQPNLQDDNYATETNTTLNIVAPGLLENDTDVDGDALVITMFLVDGVTYTVGQTANFTEGSITINENGSFTFIPTANYNGTIPIINYTVSDGTFLSNANLFISIIDLFQPIARNDFDTAEINTTLNVPAPGVLVNDTDQDNNSLSVISFIINGVSYGVGQTANFAEGSITINADGSYVFVPTVNYTGNVPTINYIISDGVNTNSANLFLTVEHITDLLEISILNSCNQGYTVDGDYKIQYSFTIRNNSTARDYHPTNLIRNINVTNDLQAVFGNGCVIEVEDVNVITSSVTDFVDNPYPLEFGNQSINQDFLTATSNSIFNNNTINNATLYPRQSINIQFCVTVNPFCNGRPNPTPSGSGIDFNNIVNATSTIGSSTSALSLTDFHTTEAIVTAGLFIPETLPEVNPNGTYDFTNTVIITNEGTSTANNVNYNMGLGSFLNNNITFNQLIVRQVSGNTVTINNAYDGDTNTKLLAPNNSIAPGETIILEIYYLADPVSSGISNGFVQLETSQTQGIIDGFDETTVENQRTYSFVVWSDNLGDHLDRYYAASNATEEISSAIQCTCTTSGIVLLFTSSSWVNKVISNVDEAPNGILEHEEITFQLTITNTSDIVQLENLQLQDNFNNICGGNIISISAPPIIQNSTATINPILNTNFNGNTDINIFDGTSGLLMADESVTIQFSIVFIEDCIGNNFANFSATNPLGNIVNSSSSTSVNVSTDNDNDGVTNANDIDDDNDTIPDVLEYNGVNPLGDDDNDFIPNYRDIDFGIDANNDGIIDFFDFDNDGVPNHFDLDSDNDGIFDIVEVGNTIADNDNNGETNNPVGLNGLDNTLENNDTVNTTINYIIPNTDAHGNPNFLDIDADGDGIVDNIEAQATDNYIPVNGTFSLTGIDTAYPNGIIPVDTEGDLVFDYIDTNSDNDIRDDFIEGWDLNNDGIAETIAINVDADNDGLDDAYDNNDALVNPTNNQVPTDFPNVDNIDNPERDWREINAVVVLIDNVFATESQNLIFTISIVTKNDNTILTQSATPINISFSTENGTDTTDIYDVATAPFDYNQVTNLDLNIPPFNSTAEFTITSLEDTIFELDELFTLNGAITSNNTANAEIEGIGTIIDNDSAPSITMNNSRENEGVDLVHTITISNPSSTPIIINVNTSDNTAISPDDYLEVISTNLTIEGTVDPMNPNLEISFSITTVLDNRNELDEEELNVIGNVTTTNVGVQDLIKTGTIIDVDPDPIVIIDNSTVVEGNPLLFTITLLNSDLEPTHNYIPIHLDLETIDQTTNIDQDYQRLQISTSIPAYTSSITQEIQTIDDRLNEDTEIMLLQTTITSTRVSNTSSIIFGTGTIKDNDIPNLFSPNSDGKSDVFKISGIEDFPNFILIIFDRWGSEVYNYSNNGNLTPIWWDGNYKGKPVVEGVYFYNLNFNDGSTAPKTGFIQLIR